MARPCCRSREHKTTDVVVMSKLLKTALATCYDPPHRWKVKEPGWVYCTKCGLITTVELAKTL